jgi:hypothetical protein
MAFSPFAFKQSVAKPLYILFVASVVVGEYLCQSLRNGVESSGKDRVAPMLCLASCGAVLVDNDIIHVQTIFWYGACHQSALTVIYVTSCGRNDNVLANELFAHFCPVFFFGQHCIQGRACYIYADKTYEEEYDAEALYAVVLVWFH